MIETKNLCKTYKPRKGVPVKALDHVSLCFPDHGMVFLLGKSGSGKSTLLNVLGGLDRYDSGEIIIKGVSSAKFKQQHFDSYRNTYVGFIFQEYNILNEFSVGANVALAIELQGKKATDEQINHILQEVDLAGYANRKPNELSGGQKQRVAIARALVKNPEIIMADEPTGALDSVTGRQVLNTLKKLSADKLVIVVSHDRDFAEKYADRIIELSDGHVIRDVTAALSESAEPDREQDGLSFNGNTVQIPAAYHLTEEDRIKINAYIDSLGGANPVSISVSKQTESASKFKQTDPLNINDRNSSPFRLIRSKLPMKCAFRIGADGLRHKKIKLVFTILLSCIAFTLFGLTDTFGSFNHLRACTQSLIDSEVNYVSLKKLQKQLRGNDKDNFYWRQGGKMNDDDLKAIENNIGLPVKGVYTSDSMDLSFYDQIDGSVELSQTQYSVYTAGFSGFSEITESDLAKFGYTLLAGNLPDGNKDEIAVSKYVYSTFEKASWCENPASKQDAGEKGFTPIRSYSDLVGKTLLLADRTYTITGIIDTGFDLARYLPLTEKTEEESTSDMLIRYALASELESAVQYGTDSIAFVGNGYLERLISDKPTYVNLNQYDAYLHYSSSQNEFWPQNIGTLRNIPDIPVTWIDSEKTTLAPNEVIVSLDLFYNMMYSPDLQEPVPTDEFLQKLKDISFTCYGHNSANEWNQDLTEVRIVGVINSVLYTDYCNLVIVDEAFFDQMIPDTSGIYSHAVGAMPQNRNKIQELVKYSYNEEHDIRYALQNSVTYELDTVKEVLASVAKVFLYIGLFFAVFASILMANFIGTSISYKKQEIGILRAIGSRSNDVFRIFFSESFIIAMINFLLSSVGTLTITLCINYLIRSRTGLLITILTFGIRQIGLLFLISVAVAAVASFLPVRKIASKRPIDAIRNR